MLTKGQTNNPAGRPKGSLNKATRDLKLAIKNFLENNTDNFQRHFNSLSAESYVKHYIALLKYTAPPAPANTELDFNDLSDDQLDYIATIVREGRRPKLKDIAARSRSALEPQEYGDTAPDGGEEILPQNKLGEEVRETSATGNTTSHSTPALPAHFGASHSAPALLSPFGAPLSAPALRSHPGVATSEAAGAEPPADAVNKRPKKAALKKKLHKKKPQSQEQRKQHGDSTGDGRAKPAEILASTQNSSSGALPHTTTASQTDLPQADEPPTDPLFRYFWDLNRRRLDAENNAAMQEGTKPPPYATEKIDRLDDPVLKKWAEERRANRDMYRTYDDIDDQV